MHIKISFQEQYGTGWATKPLEVTCTMTYDDPKLLQTITATATAPTHHKAKQLAHEKLKVSVEDNYETAPLDTQPPNPYNSLRDRFEDRAAELIHNHFEAGRVQYLLDKLQEEAAEIIQAVSKIRRFGPDNHHPDRETTNLQELIAELEDFQAIVLALEATKYLDPKPTTQNIIKKYNTLMGT
jgi:NTP pyrophosphatase (non-canonical NTP hydrolase)